MTVFTLTKEEHERLVKLYKDAQTTPVIYTGGGGSWADSAWNEVRSYMDELGEKYGYDPRTAGIGMYSPTFEAMSRNHTLPRDKP